MNKLYERVMNGVDVDDSTLSRLFDWLDSNINDGMLTDDMDKVELYEMMKKDLKKYIGFLWG